MRGNYQVSKRDVLNRVEILLFKFRNKIEFMIYEFITLGIVKICRIELKTLFLITIVPRKVPNTGNFLLRFSAKHQNCSQDSSVEHFSFIRKKIARLGSHNGIHTGNGVYSPKNYYFYRK